MKDVRQGEWPFSEDEIRALMVGTRIAGVEHTCTPTGDDFTIVLDDGNEITLRSERIHIGLTLRSSASFFGRELGPGRARAARGRVRPDSG